MAPRKEGRIAVSRPITLDASTRAALVVQVRAWLEAAHADRARALETRLLCEGFDPDAIAAARELFDEEGEAAIAAALVQAADLFARGAP